MGVPEQEDGQTVEQEEKQEQLRAVEVWLKDVEAEMRGSLRDHVDRAEAASCKTHRAEWLFYWPAQVVLALEQCRWTQAVELQGLSANQEVNSSMQRTLAAEEQKLAELVDLTRSLRGGPGRDQVTLGALIVLSVHSRDVTAALLRGGVTSADEFDWVA